MFATHLRMITEFKSMADVGKSSKNELRSNIRKLSAVSEVLTTSLQKRDPQECEEYLTR